MNVFNFPNMFLYNDEAKGGRDPHKKFKLGK